MGEHSNRLDAKSLSESQRGALVKSCAGTVLSVRSSTDRLGGRCFVGRKKSLGTYPLRGAGVPRGSGSNHGPARQTVTIWFAASGRVDEWRQRYFVRLRVANEPVRAEELVRNNRPLKCQDPWWSQWFAENKVWNPNPGV